MGHLAVACSNRPKGRKVHHDFTIFGKESRYGNMASKDPGGDLDRSIRHVANSGQPIVTQRPDGLLIRDGGDRGAPAHCDVTGSDVGRSR